MATDKSQTAASLPLFAMQDTSKLSALVAAAETSPEAMSGLAGLLAEALAGRALASDVASMITDLFGSSDPRKVAEGARGALAIYSVTKRLGPGSDMLTSSQNNQS